MSGPMGGGVPAGSRPGNMPGSLVPKNESPVADASAAPAVNADADQVGEPAVVESVAAARGPLALEAVGLGKDFKLGRGAVLHAVRNVRLSLYQGAVVALVGESGSGKSTVAKLLAGQERRTHGTITLDGKQLGQLKIVDVPAPAALKGGPDNTYVPTTGSGAIRAAAKSTVLTQGALEGSNVDTAQAMTDMIEAQRAFQMASKAITTQDEILQIANQVKR